MGGGIASGDEGAGERGGVRADRRTGKEAPRAAGAELTATDGDLWTLHAGIVFYTNRRTSEIRYQILAPADTPPTQETIERAKTRVSRALRSPVIRREIDRWAGEGRDG